MELAAVPRELSGGPDGVLDPDVVEAWNNMKRRLQELAAQSNGQAYDPRLDREGVLANLDRIQNSGRRDSGRMSAVRDVFADTLMVVQRVGGLLADAASQVSLSSMSLGIMRNIDTC
jgi:hypothetical protein